MLDNLGSGDIITAQLEVKDNVGTITSLAKTGTAPPDVPKPSPLSDGIVLTLKEGQTAPDAPLVDQDGKRVALLHPGSRIVVRISVRAKDAVALPIVGFMMRNHLGIDFAGTNTRREEYVLPPTPPAASDTGEFHRGIPEL